MTTTASLAVLAVLVLVGSAPRPGRAAVRRPGEGTRLELRPVFMRPCSGIHNNALTVVDVVYEYQGRTNVVFNFNATINHSADHWSKVKMIVDKCDGTVSTSSCSPFRTFEFADVCGTMMNPLMPWARVVNEIRPKLTCPVKKGTYALVNGTLSMEMLVTAASTMRLEGQLWRARSVVMDGQGAPHMCVDVAGEIFRVRINKPKG